MCNTFLKLPFTFSEALLLKDLEHCNGHQYNPHFNTRDYIGDWTSVSLRSPSGEINNVVAHADSYKDYKDTQLMDQCLYFKEIAASFLCEKESIRLLKLSPGSIIKEHTDFNLSYEDGLFRIHIPIQTNEEVEFYINNEKVEMKVGSCWYGNFNLPHRVTNNGKTARVHLVMDCVRNSWSDALFREMGYDFSEEGKAVTYDLDTKIKMMEALRHLDTETSRAMLKQLERELAAGN